jgi:diguanylate cyclase (GGDEF)-like protein/PAS domain S-box-containing protein
MDLLARPLRVLNVEDRRLDAELLEHALENEGYSLHWQRVETEAEFLLALEDEADIILADYSLPRFSGLRALELLKESDRDIPFILISGILGEDEAVEAMRLGADDYLLKDRILRLGPAISSALERKATRAALRRLELARLKEGDIHRTIFEQAACGIGIVSLDWRYLVANDALCRMLGRSREELLGMTVGDVTHPDDVSVSDTVRRALLSGAEGELVQPLEKRYLRPDGTVVWAEVTASLVPSAVPGEQSQLVATMLDVSVRKSAEEAREESRQFAQSTIDSLGQPICVIDEDGTILAVNRAWPKIMNLEGSYLALATIGANYLDLCELGNGSSLSLARELAAGIREVIHGRRDSFTLEYAFQSQDQKRYIRSRVTRFHGANPVRTTIVHTDVTSRVVALRKLRESEARFRGTFEQAAVGIAHISLDGHFSLVNTKLCTILGYPREVLLNMRFLDLMVPDDRAGYLMSRATILSGEQEADACERRFVHASGEVIWINLVTNVERARAGDPRYFISVFEQISIRKLTQFRLHRLNRLHSVLSRVSSAIVRIHDRQELFDTACQIVVNQGQLRMAYIGVVDEVARVVRPMAWFGEGLEYLSQPTSIIPLDGGPLGQGTLGTALRTGTRDYCNNIAQTERMKPWHEAAAKNGLLASASFPFYLRGRIVAVLELYSAEVDYFLDDELRLMNDVASSMSFALEALELEAERRHAAELLHRQQSELSALFDLVPAMLFIKNTENGFIRVNQRLAQTIGKPVEEIEGKSVFDFFPAEAAAYFADDLEVIRTGKPKLGIVERLNGSTTGDLWVQTDKVPYRDGQGNVIGLIGMVRDITESRQAEVRLKFLNRVYAVLSGINTLIVHVQDLDELFTEACRIAVDAGGFKAAFLAIVDDEAMCLQIVAADGDNGNYVDEVQERMSLRDDAISEHGPCVTAVKTQLPVIINNIAEDPRIERKEPLTRHGVKSTLSMPLFVDNEVHAVFALHAGDIGFFDEAEVKLLMELSDDIAFAIANIKKQKRLEYLKRVNDVTSAINAIVVRVRERDELLREACRIAVGKGGFGMAMLGLIDSASGKIITIGIESADERALRFVRSIVADQAVDPNQMTIQAIREKACVVANDSQNDPRVVYGPQHAEFGVRAMAILPLIVADQVIGIFALYAKERDFFHDEEIRLLTELTGDISFAIDHLDKKAKLDYLAYYDALTGLANRTLFTDRLGQSMRSAGQVGREVIVIVLDLERFRNVNESLGRTAGDILLKHVGEFLAHQIGDRGLVARVGVDQFAALVPESELDEDVGPFAETLLARLRDSPFHFDGADYQISAKLGAARFPTDANGAETLIQNAEAALMRAKVTGERHLSYAATMTSSVSHRLTLENKLRLALSNSEFILYYQPKMNLTTGKLAGAEALLRWNDPQIGMVAPAQFIPVLEETGLIHDVGRWVIAQALSDGRRWRNLGFPAVRIAVNVSPLQLRSRDFVPTLGAMLSLDPQSSGTLEVEFTESVIMQDVNHTIDRLHAICEFGVSIAIDDFGTGYSSLSYLSKLPLHTLKIDRSFTNEMTTSSPGLALVSTIINLARSLKLKVVAEGVESEEQANLLRLLSCDEIQGFLIAKPMPVELFESNFLRKS